MSPKKALLARIFDAYDKKYLNSKDETKTKELEIKTWFFNILDTIIVEHTLVRTFTSIEMEVLKLSLKDILYDSDSHYLVGREILKNFATVRKVITPEDYIRQFEITYLCVEDLRDTLEA